MFARLIFAAWPSNLRAFNFHHLSNWGKLTAIISRSTVHAIVHQVTTIPLDKLLCGCYLASPARRTAICTELVGSGLQNCGQYLNFVTTHIIKVTTIFKSTRSASVCTGTLPLCCTRLEVYVNHL